ncbi:BTAD domain-containing putative transcriptional regulator [Streptomyces sp. NPDC001822]|uniref:AfsR/SARP family transcriptional regulator n=1 Tax=Streptomyces sp. NPDC001822 TaxID=3364614 RepID=UPI00369F93F5
MKSSHGTSDATVRYSLLGTVRAVRGDSELDLGPPKRLALLSLLLLRAPGPVSLSDAVDVLWDDEPPASAVNVVHRHIGALRKLLEPGLRSRTDAEHLSRAADGYRLLADTSTSDLLRFRDLRARARLAVESGNPAQAATDFMEALRLWRSPVVADGTPVAWHPVFTSVGHEFVATAKEATDVVLGAAPALTEEVLSILRCAVDSHPFDEAIHSRIIAALASTGRQAEALKQFEGIRRTLADELGVEPGPGLRAARRHFLQRGCSQRAKELTARAQAPQVPPHLPANPSAFVGRHEVSGRILGLATRGGGSEPPAATVAISGMAGVGKTTLAVRCAHLVADRFPDGQIYVDLRGHHPDRPRLDSAQAMTAVLDALGVGRGGGDLDAAALGSVYRSALAGRRLLLVLDDAAHCEQVRPLLPATPGSLAIITSRRKLEGLAVTHYAELFTLDPMPPRESMQLLERRLGAARLRAESDAVDEIVELCGGLPLALAVVGTRALTGPRPSLALLAAELRDGLPALFSGDPRTDVRSVFQRSYEMLSVGGAHLFRALSQHPSPEITLRAAASLADTGLHVTRQNLAELADHHLLVEHVPGRYTCHELLRAFADDLSSTLDASSTRSETRARMFEHYVYSADAATALIAPHRRTLILPPPRPGVHPQEFQGCADAAAWVSAQRHLLPALVRALDHYPRAAAFQRQLTSTMEMSLHPNSG